MLDPQQGTGNSDRGGGTPLSILTSPTGSERPVDPATLEPVSERTTGRLQNIPPFGTNLAETMWRAKISKIIRGGATPTSCRSLASAPIRFHWTITTPTTTWRTYANTDSKFESSMFPFLPTHSGQDGLRRESVYRGDCHSSAA